MSHPFAITDQLIDDTLCTALEGGINYWAESADPLVWPEGDTPYASDAVSKGATLVVVVDPDIAERPAYFLTRAAMQYAIRAYCKEHKLTPADLDDDPVDASGADDIVQLALFGEVVFG